MAWRIPSVLILALSLGCTGPSRNPWSDDEIRTLRSMSLRALPSLGRDPSNRVADDARAVVLGKRLFADARFSANGRVSCASCHDGSKLFQDGIPRGRGVGTSARRTMTLAGSGYVPYLFWDGRKDSLWAQALAPLENGAEHASSRKLILGVVGEAYRADYEDLFGELSPPTDERSAETARAFANVGKSIAAYVRRLRPGPSRFDAYVDAVVANDAKGQAVLSVREIAGLRVFFGKGKCATCHNGPLFTDGSFHNTGVPTSPGLPVDDGRIVGARRVMGDEFNCKSPYSDASPDECVELNFILYDDPTLAGAFKTASLRNVSERPPYMHAGQFATLREVVQHYDRPRPAHVGTNELRPLGLSLSDTADLESFLGTLAGGVVEGS